jgi:hypothetical protein
MFKTKSKVNKVEMTDGEPNKDDKTVSSRSGKWRNTSFILGQELDLHQEIRLNFRDKFLLFLTINFKIIHKCCFNRKAAFEKLYNEGDKKIEKMLDLLRIVKDNRKFKVVLENSIMNKEILEQIKHTEYY